MPNTLAHFGVNGLLTKSVYKKTDLVWIYLGCIIPDIPWIIRKIIEFTFPKINGYDLQAYVIIQATLFFSIILSLTFASISKNTLRTFLILSFGSLLHLLLDPVQIKWANGVHLFAPFNWHITEYGFFWPESFGTYFLTFGGLIFFIYTMKELKNVEFPLIISFKKTFTFVVFLIIYFSLPLFFLESVKKADNHFLSTLENHDQRSGKYVEMDRKNVKFNNSTNSYWIESFNHDYIELENVPKITSSRLSIQGKFVNNDKIFVTDFHENWVLFRDGASYFGILLTIITWIIALIKKTKI
jgi:hypothetical protein